MAKYLKVYSKALNKKEPVFSCEMMDLIYEFIPSRLSINKLKSVLELLIEEFKASENENLKNQIKKCILKCVK